VEAGVELAGREHDKDVVGVGIYGGDETPRPTYARLPEHGVVRGVAEQGQVAFCRHSSTLASRWSTTTNLVSSATNSRATWRPTRP